MDDQPSSRGAGSPLSTSDDDSNHPPPADEEVVEPTHPVVEAEVSKEIRTQDDDDGIPGSQDHDFPSEPSRPDPPSIILEAESQNQRSGPQEESQLAVFEDGENGPDVSILPRGDRHAREPSERIPVEDIPIEIPGVLKQNPSDDENILQVVPKNLDPELVDEDVTMDAFSREVEDDGPKDESAEEPRSNRPPSVIATGTTIDPLLSFQEDDDDGAENVSDAKHPEEKEPPTQSLIQGQIDLNTARSIHSLMSSPHQHPNSFGYAQQIRASMPSTISAPIMVVGGKRKVHLRLEEEIENRKARSSGILNSIRRTSMFRSDTLTSMNDLQIVPVDRGNVTVSWFEGTSSLELQEHVRKSVIRKLKLQKKITDFRVLDETVDPPEEIVLSPYIPDGSRFLLRFSTKDLHNDGMSTPGSNYSSYHPPLSPSAAPSPGTSRQISGLSKNQLLMLQLQLNSLKTPGRSLEEGNKEEQNKEDQSKPKAESGILKSPHGSPSVKTNNDVEPSLGEEVSHTSDHDELDSEDPIEARLRQITELLIDDRNKRKARKNRDKEEKRQVIFTLANYFVLFLSLIAISAEIQARAPGWAAWMETQLESVQRCATNQDALFKCISDGDFAGLVASVILWLSRSVATRRIFLFGFDTPKKLWTVVYESFVTALCWGISYMFIRRGMNPDTRPRFLQKYWKDAMYGSLAGFNAAFLKQVLKNLIPQEVVEDALRERQLKILSWLPSFE